MVRCADPYHAIAVAGHTSLQDARPRGYTAGENAVLGGPMIADGLEHEEQQDGFGVGIPVFLGLWLICAVAAALIWQGLVNDTPGHNNFSAVATLVLGLGFGFAGAGLVALAVYIVRKP